MGAGLIVATLICSLIILYIIWVCTVKSIRNRRVGLESHASGQEVQYEDELGLAHDPEPKATQ